MRHGQPTDVGDDPLDLCRDDVLNSGYLLVSDPAADEAIRLLEVWDCPFCGRGSNWALITVNGTEMTAIEAVALDRATLESANFISEVDADMLAATLRGRKQVRAAWRS